MIIAISQNYIHGIKCAVWVIRHHHISYIKRLRVVESYASKEPDSRERDLYEIP